MITDAGPCGCELGRVCGRGEPVECRFVQPDVNRPPLPLPQFQLVAQRHQFMHFGNDALLFVPRQATASKLPSHTKPSSIAQSPWAYSLSALPSDSPTPANTGQGAL